MPGKAATSPEPHNSSQHNNCSWASRGLQDLVFEGDVMSQQVCFEMAAALDLRMLPCYNIFCVLQGTAVLPEGQLHPAP